MSLQETDRDIDAFWSWLRTNVLRLEAMDGVALGELDARVAALSIPAWEIGPDDGEGFALTLSPDGDPGAAGWVRQVCSRAPNLPGWTIRSARGRREPALEFDIETRHGLLGVDARPWRYLLRRGRGDLVDLEVEVGESVLSDDDLGVAVVLAVDGLLGEARRLECIGSIRFYERLDDADRPRLLRHLPAHLDEALPPAPERDG